MKFDTENWQPFKVGDLFYKLENGKANQTMLEEGEDCFYVGAKRNENGVMFHCAYDAKLVQKGNCIIFICNGEGSVGYANYMSMDFIGTTDIVAGYNEHLNEYTGPFIATIASLERPKFSYGRKWKKFLKNTELYLPVDGCGNPNWQFMEDYVKSLHHKPLTTKNTVGNGLALKVDEWKKFRVGDLFSITRGKTLSTDDKEEYAGNDYSCINGGSANNGELCKMSSALQNQGFLLQEVPSLSLSRVGNAGLTYLQTLPYYIADNAFSLKLKFQQNDFVYMFLSTCLNQELFKYSYGRTISSNKYLETMMKLPIQHNPDGTPYIDCNCIYSEDGYVPDWQFMENYIKSLPYGDRI